MTRIDTDNSPGKGRFELLCIFLIFFFVDQKNRSCLFNYFFHLINASPGIDADTD